MTAVPLAVGAQRPARSTAADRLGDALASLERLDPDARGVAQQALRAVVEMYAEGIDRLLDLATGGVIEVERLADDELWNALLALHGRHPVPVAERVERALESVRPYLNSHHGGVTLVDIDGDVALIRLSGGCDGCGASEQTLRGLVESTIVTAAPEIATVELAPSEPAPTLLQITPRPVDLTCPFPGEPAGE